MGCSFYSFSYLRYNSNVDIGKDMNVPLNENHTHFMMIDDGYKFRYYGGVNTFVGR